LLRRTGSSLFIHHLSRASS